MDRCNEKTSVLGVDRPPLKQYGLFNNQKQNYRKIHQSYYWALTPKIWNRFVKRCLNHLMVVYHPTKNLKTFLIPLFLSLLSNSNLTAISVTSILKVLPESQNFSQLLWLPPYLWPWSGSVSSPLPFLYFTPPSPCLCTGCLSPLKMGMSPHFCFCRMWDTIWHTVGAQ
jgi:hypothetical protein